MKKHNNTEHPLPWPSDEDILRQKRSPLRSDPGPGNMDVLTGLWPSGACGRKATMLAVRPWEPAATLCRGITLGLNSSLSPPFPWPPSETHTWRALVLQARATSACACAGVCGWGGVISLAVYLPLFLQYLSWNPVERKLRLQRLKALIVSHQYKGATSFCSFFFFFFLWGSNIFCCECRFISRFRGLIRRKMSNCELKSFFLQIHKL